MTKSRLADTGGPIGVANLVYTLESLFGSKRKKDV